MSFRRRTAIAALAAAGLPIPVLTQGKIVLGVFPMETAAKEFPSRKY